MTIACNWRLDAVPQHMLPVASTIQNYDKWSTTIATFAGLSLHDEYYHLEYLYRGLRNQTKRAANPTYPAKPKQSH